MGRYKRKSARTLKFTEELFLKIKEKLSKGWSKRAVTRQYNIHEATLRKRLKKYTIPANLGRFKNIFCEDMEQKLPDHVRKLDSLFFGITLKQLQIAAFQYAEINNIKNRFSKEKGMAGKVWAISFVDAII